MKLEQLGWADPFNTAFESLADQKLAPARVAAAQREHHRLLTEHGVFDARLSGRLRHEARPGELPVVGDWVAAQLQPDQGSATIVASLPRRSALVRKRPERSSAPQVLAANLDVVLLVTSLNRDFNPRRIERTLAMIWEGGAQPVVLLSKLDLCEEAASYREQAEAVALGVPVHALSAHSGEGLDELAPYLQPARTLALIGSSGVGKSTLVNALLGQERLATADVRASDDRGRHTTTARELFVLPAGALLIDTPGLRELGLWDAAEGLDAAFEDVDALAASCRFGDCGHGSEPGCTIRAAMQNGTLDAERYASYLKLQRELAYEERRRDPQALLEYRQQTRRVFRARRRVLRRSPKK
jgi:ribosome biogenesis GTPase